MPHTTGGARGGNLEIDRQIRQLGTDRGERRLRFTVASTDPKVLRHANTMIDKLIRLEQWEALRGLRDGSVMIHELLEADRAGKVGHKLLTKTQMKLYVPLWDREIPTEQGSRIEAGAISKAFRTMEEGASRDRYVYSFAALQRKAGDVLPADAVVKDLLRVDWKALYARWGASNADWMRMRQGLSKFCSIHLGRKHHPFGERLRSKIPTKIVRARKPKITFEVFLQILDLCPPHAQAAYWVLAVTGVRRGEYLRSTKDHINAATHTYDVPGRKNAASDATITIDARWWPFIEQGIPSRLKEAWLRRYFKRACLELGLAKLVGTGKFKLVKEKLGPGIPVSLTPRKDVRQEVLKYQGPTLHDLRHCFGQWAVNAGVAESKIQAALRHASPAMTRRYVMQHETGEVSSALADSLLSASTGDTDGSPTGRRRPSPPVLHQ